MIRVRPERAGEADAARAIHLAAFPTRDEATLVDRLRNEGDILVSLVAEADGELLGHVVLTPARLDPPDPECRGAALGPLAVCPPYQGRQIGARLVLAGLEACRDAEIGWVAVLGDPAYYSRFGFRPASEFGLSDPWNGGSAFQALELKTGCLLGEAGLVQYPPAFARLAAIASGAA